MHLILLCLCFLFWIYVVIEYYYVFYNIGYYIDVLEIIILNIMFLFIYNVNFLFVDAKGGENMKIYICINNGGEKYENMKNLYAYI